MTTISNIQELQAEIRKLEAEVINKEKSLRSDILELKAGLNPGVILKNAIMKMSSGEGENGKLKLTSGLIKAGAILMLQRFLMKSEGKLEDRVLAIVNNGFFKIREWIRGLNKKNKMPVIIEENDGEGEEY